MNRVRVPLVPLWLRLAGVIAVVTVILYYSLITVPPEPSGSSPFWDKYLHFAAYAAVALALAYAAAHYRDRPYRRAALVLGGAIAFGTFVELLQGMLPYRYFGLGDLLANALGAALIALWFPIERRIRYVHARKLFEKGLE